MSGRPDCTSRPVPERRSPGRRGAPGSPVERVSKPGARRPAMPPQCSVRHHRGLVRHRVSRRSLTIGGAPPTYPPRCWQVASRLDGRGSGQGRVADARTTSAHRGSRASRDHARCFTWNLAPDRAAVSMTPAAWKTRDRARSRPVLQVAPVPLGGRLRRRCSSVHRFEGEPTGLSPLLAALGPGENLRAARCGRAGVCRTRELPCGRASRRTPSRGVVGEVRGAFNCGVGDSIASSQLGAVHT